ncbi:MAG: pseudouridine synthase [Planctomycetota bacterium]|nr:MAG: pseudouridine synthase [Planctomycetota bacterium]
MTSERPTRASEIRTHDYTDKNRGTRLQKVLADAGVAARRECEELVRNGAVTVNGKTVDMLPAWVNPDEDRIEVYGRPLRKAEKHVSIMLFKPRGTVCTNSDPEGRPRAIDLVDHPSRPRLYCVGRLDLDASGLLILTNDGEFANRLTHPRYEVFKGYDVTLDGSIDEYTIAKIEHAIFKAEGGGPAKSSLRMLKRDRDATTVHMELCEHRNLQLKPLMLSLGYPVKKMRRTSFGPLKLKGLAVGEWRELTAREIQQLKRASRNEEANASTATVSKGTTGGKSTRMAAAPSRNETAARDKSVQPFNPLKSLKVMKSKKLHAPRLGRMDRSGPSTAPRPSREGARPLNVDTPRLRADDREDTREEPRADTRAPRFEAKAPRADTRAPRFDSKAPRADTRAPRLRAEAPRADTRAPRGDFKAPRAPREDRYESAEPPREIHPSKRDAPRAESKAPRADARASKRPPRSPSQSPRAASRKPAAERAPRAEPAARKDSKRAPRNDGGHAQRFNSKHGASGATRSQATERGASAPVRATRVVPITKRRADSRAESREDTREREPKSFPKSGGKSGGKSFSSKPFGGKSSSPKGRSR